MQPADRLGARSELCDGIDYWRLGRLAELGIADPDRLPVTLKILLENAMRHAGTRFSSDDDVVALAGWTGRSAGNAGGGGGDGADGVGLDRERAFVPARVLLQDFTGVPAVVDLAAMRDAMRRGGADPGRIDPQVPVDLVVDHSVQVDAFGSGGAYATNIDREYERNHERYELLRWAQRAFNGFRVVPPGMGIVHQVNLEYLARVVDVRDIDGRKVAIPDTLVGTDSHTTMINGIGVLGWGVGGIEAEAVMLGQPLFLLTPVVVGVQFDNALPAGTTATDLVLTLTELLRGHGVVGKFVEFCGAGLTSMTAADRATLANMAPEYGATAALFPVDDQTLGYLRETGREASHIDIVERYCKAQGMFRTDATLPPRFSEMLNLDLATVVPSVAGPRRPQDRVALGDIWRSFIDVYSRPAPAVREEVVRLVGEGGRSLDSTNPGIGPGRTLDDSDGGEGLGGGGGPGDGRPVRAGAVRDGSVVIAAITSCTNTSNPSVMIAAGLLARNAVVRGLTVPEHVKTSLAPGSRVVTDYLRRSHLLDALEALRFNVVGYGCTTCIGNSGPLPETVAERIDEYDLAVAAVLSGNRNFEGRIHPQVKAAYLASPPLVVAFALAGTVRINLLTEPLGRDREGGDVYLRDLWPSAREVREVIAAALGRDLFHDEYGRIFEGDDRWRALAAPQGLLFDWHPDSTYVREPTFFGGALGTRDIADARVLAFLGDSITTDHISPAGSISLQSPAATYLREHGVEPRNFNTYGSRRGNHEVMVRGTFANIRLRNRLAGGTEGGATTHIGSGERMTIYHAAMRYAVEGHPLVVLAGREYGSGSSRDWAAKGPALLGVRAVIAESFERIHRSNLVGMGILPLQFLRGESADRLGLSGREAFTVEGAADASAGGRLRVRAVRDDDTQIVFDVISRLDSATDVSYHRAGGILPLVLSQLAAG